MVIDAIRFAMDLPISLSRTLSAKVKPLITQCSIRYLYALDRATYPNKETIISAAKAMERRRCGHHELETPLSDFDCMRSVIDPKSVRQDTDLVNRFNYVVAAQDEEIRAWCRRVRGTPLVHVKRSVMVMERMSEGSVRVRDGEERGKLRAGIKKQGPNGVLGKRKQRDNEDETARDSADGTPREPVERAKKRQRGVKGPNPLSVRKAKSKDVKLKSNEMAEKRDKQFQEARTDQDSARDVAQDVVIQDTAIAQETTSGRRRKRKHKPKIADDGGREEGDEGGVAVA